jgi:hypothetical protein
MAESTLPSRLRYAIEAPATIQDETCGRVRAVDVSTLKSVEDFSYPETVFERQFEDRASSLPCDAS